MYAISIQEDRLSSLPDDIIHHLSHLLTQLHTNGRRELSWERLVCSCRITPKTAKYQPLRGCCKRLTSISDELRPSIFFHAEQWDEVEPYLQKIPSLKVVSILYNSKDCGVTSSLTSLQNVLSGLTSLTLSHSTTSSQGYIPITRIDHALLLWRASLQHLELTKMTCISYAESETRGLRFLSYLPSLKTLVLNDVAPVLEAGDIAGCTSLHKLSLWGCGQHSCMNVGLDLSAVTSLQEVSCKQFELNSLNVSGLTALRVLDCHNNPLKSLDVSSCTALEKLSLNETGLQELDVSHNTQLTLLECCSLKIASLNVTGCTLLTQLYCDSDFDGFTELDLSTCISLKTLSCEGINVSTLDLSGCPNLTELSLRNSKELQTLDLTCCKSLTSVNLRYSSVVCVQLAAGCSQQMVDWEDSEETTESGGDGTNNVWCHRDGVKLIHLVCVSLQINHIGKTKCHLSLKLFICLLQIV